jgi:hypothetical protein
MTHRRIRGSLALTLLFVLAGWLPDAKATLISGDLNGVVTAANDFFGLLGVKVGDPAFVHFEFDTVNPELTVSMTSLPAVLTVPYCPLVEYPGGGFVCEGGGPPWLTDLNYSVVHMPRMDDFLTLDFEVQNLTGNFNAIFLKADGYLSPGTSELDPNRSRLIQVWHAEEAGYYYASSPVPEPCTLGLTLLGLPMLWWQRKRLAI